REIAARKHERNLGALAFEFANERIACRIPRTGIMAIALRKVEDEPPVLPAHLVERCTDRAELRDIDRPGKTRRLMPEVEAELDLALRRGQRADPVALGIAPC